MAERDLAKVETGVRFPLTAYRKVMNLKNIHLGTPKNPNVVIEIPAGSPNKFEYDETVGSLKLDFVFRNGFHFPFNYGFVPHTLAEDNDPLDAAVLSTELIPPLTVVSVKPIAILKLKDRGEQDNKLITVPLVDPLAENLNSLADLTENQKKEIVAFFKEVGVQKNKIMDIEGFEDKNAAIEEVRKCTRS